MKRIVKYRNIEPKTAKRQKMVSPILIDKFVVDVQKELQINKKSLNQKSSEHAACFFEKKFRQNSRISS